MHPGIDPLTAVLPVPRGIGRCDRLARSQRAVGDGLSSDYRDFVATYGGGSVNASFHIGLPVKISNRPSGPLDFEELTELGLELISGEDDEPPPADARISWACDAGANHLFWNTTDLNPDNWTVVRLTRDGEWTDFECGMVEFMIRFLTGSITPQPMALFDPERPVFTHWRAQDAVTEIVLAKAIDLYLQAKLATRSASTCPPARDGRPVAPGERPGSDARLCRMPSP